MTCLGLLPLAFALSGCAYIGEPLPPSVHIPSRIRDLTAVEHGNQLILRFTIPELTTDGVTVTRLGAIDLRGGPTVDPFDANRWADGAKQEIQVEATPHVPGPVTAMGPVPAWMIGKEVVFAVRLSSPKGRFSDWSNYVALRIVPPLPRPEQVTAQNVLEGVRLTWHMPPSDGAPSFRIFRRAEKEDKPVLLQTVTGHEYIDTTTTYGKLYEYSVQATLEAESEISETSSLTPVDAFPPATPAGLAAIASPGAIELSWQRNTESDLKSYRVYRSVEGGHFELVSDSGLPSFDDRHVEAGKRYQYAVSSVDQSDNPSPRSAPVEATAQ